MVKLALFSLAGIAFICISGCAEGMLWRTGYLSPWVRQTWEDEEKIATTLFSRKRQMTESVDAVISGSMDQKTGVAKQLQEVVFRDPILLLRLHAVKLLGDLNCAASLDALQSASKDQNHEIRIAAVKSLGRLPENEAILILQDVVGSDTHGDVRLAATQTLGKFSSSQTLKALAIAIEDRDPALQIAAIESLESVTGEDFGNDIFAWKSYLGSQSASSNRSVAERTPGISDPGTLRR